MYLTAVAERLAAATLQVHLAAIVTAHRLVGLSLDPGHPSIALLLDGIRRRKGTRPSRNVSMIMRQAVVQFRLGGSVLF
jgi:hypothetical protein